MGDNPISAAVSPQRKLPNPANSANTNSTLKGILIKPKRILPAQPDNLKLKRTIPDSSSEYKADDSAIENSRADFNPSSKDENSNTNSSQKVSIPKLQIDVDRLKSYFKLQGKATGISEKRKADQNENNITATTAEASDTEQTCPRQAVRECGAISGVTSHRDNNSFSFKTDGLAKVKEWCSVSEIGKMTAKMASDPSVAKTLERSIRSPSPKSNTTWDRSSSGYSSDERADPRSPPPSHSASVSVSSKAETEITNDDDVSVSNTTEAGDNPNDIEPDDIDTKTCKDKLGTNENKTLISDNNASSDTLVSLAGLESDKSTLVNESENSSCDQCDANNNGAEKSDTTNSCVNFSFDNVLGNKQTPKRPSWTAHSPSPANGRVIQYRKSGSESLISLRHTNRQGSLENNFGGLEVCGKSFPQQATNNSSIKIDTNVSDSNEQTTRPEILSPTSAFSPVPRLATNTEISETHLIDSHGQEMAARTRFFRQSLTPCRTPRDIRDMRNLPMTTTVKLPIPQDDKDIRRTLHDLNSPRRQTPGGKSLPVRARHPIQPVIVTDTNSNQPMGTSVTNNPRTATSDSGKLGIKLFSKKMWRSPPGLPENAQARPFSPFGGTLPPAKIKEQEQKRHATDNSA